MTYRLLTHQFATPVPTEWDVWQQDALDIFETIELALKRGYEPAYILAENSQIRDRIRAAIASSPIECEHINWEKP